jgi:hypothetical protein
MAGQVHVNAIDDNASDGIFGDDMLRCGNCSDPSEHFEGMVHMARSLKSMFGCELEALKDLITEEQSIRHIYASIHAHNL